MFTTLTSQSYNLTGGVSLFNSLSETSTLANRWLKGVTQICNEH